MVWKMFIELEMLSRKLFGYYPQRVLSGGGGVRLPTILCELKSFYNLFEEVLLNVI